MTPARAATIRAAFAAQGAACAALGSPFYARLMPVLAAALDPATPVGARVLDWPGDPAPTADSVPLRLAGALHGLVLAGAAPALAALWPPTPDSDRAALRDALAGALRDQAAAILPWLDRAPQTNEVRRAGVILAGLWWALGQVGDRAVVLSEMGASGGLNLMLDRFALVVGGAAHGAADAALTLTPDWRGAAPPAPRPVRVVDRAGVDLVPIDPRTPEGTLRLLAYLWPDQPARLARTRAAIAVAAAPVAQGDAAPWLAARLDAPRPGALHAVFTTIAAQYFPASTRARIAATLDAAGVRATADAPLLHLAMEADGAASGAAVDATLWTGAAPPLRQRLGRADFHGDWIAWGGD